MTKPHIRGSSKPNVDRQNEKIDLTTSDEYASFYIVVENQSDAEESAQEIYKGIRKGPTKHSALSKYANEVQLCQESVPESSICATLVNNSNPASENDLYSPRSTVKNETLDTLQIMDYSQLQQVRE